MRRLRAPLLIVLALLTAFRAVAEPLFAEACQDPALMANRPATGILKWSYPAGDGAGHETGVFLASVLELAVAKLDKDLAFTSNLLQCLGERRGEEVCADLEVFATVDLPKLVNDARFNLIAGQSPLDFKSTFGRGDTVPNYRMRDWGTAKVHAWEPPTPAEKTLVTKVLKDYRAETVAHYLKAWGQSKYTGSYGEREAVNASMFAVRIHHFQQYRSLLAAAPFLGYFTAPSPGVAEVRERFLEFAVNARAEKAYLETLIVRLRGAVNESYSESLEAAVQYRAYIEFSLLEAPEYCGLVAALLATRENRALAFGIGVGAPLLLASFFAPGVFSYPLGIIASGYFALESYNRYELARVRAQSVLFLDPGTESNENLVDAKNQFGTDVLLFPLSFVGGRIVGTSIRSFAAGRVLANPALNAVTYLPKRVLKVFETYGRREL